MKSLLTLAAGAALLIADSPTLDHSVGQAQAQRKPRPACGLKAWPIIEGSEMVYESRAMPGRPTPKQPPPKPIQPEKVTIKVLSVKTERQVTTIELEESVGYMTYKTTLTCERDKVNVPPKSFFFSGEPGGGINIEITELERTAGNSYLFRGGKVIIPEWTEDLKGKFNRTVSDGGKAQMANGTLDLQRVVIIGPPEPVTTDLGDLQASPVQIDLRGSVTLDITPEEQYTFNVPANTISKLWFAENLGVVQVANTNGHLYMLTSITGL